MFRNKIHKEILTQKQVAIWPLLEKFSGKFGLVGGTAIALHIGHRESIDFDLFSLEEFSSQQIRQQIVDNYKIEKVFYDEKGEYTVLVNGVRLTFFHYPYAIEFSEKIDRSIRLPSLITLVAMKAHALGRRAKWKDYVDIYFVLKDYCSLTEIEEKSKVIFGAEFNAKIFRSQLSYFDDIDYSERVIYRPGFATEDEIIKRSLIEFSLAE
jgi:hypothetical protein